MNARSTWEMPTPWGYATYMNEVAEGIVIYETDERGGIHLSDSRNERIPDAVKQMTQKGVDGWYDNDGEARVVRMFYPAVSSGGLAAPASLAPVLFSIGHRIQWHPGR